MSPCRAHVGLGPCCSCVNYCANEITLVPWTHFQAHLSKFAKPIKMYVRLSGTLLHLSGTAPCANLHSVVASERRRRQWMHVILIFRPRNNGLTKTKSFHFNIIWAHLFYDCECWMLNVECWMRMCTYFIFMRTFFPLFGSLVPLWCTVCSSVRQSRQNRVVYAWRQLRQ